MLKLNKNPPNDAAAFAGPASSANLARSITPTYFHTIDILRGFAALSVLVYHVIELFDWKSFPTSGPLSWFRGGWMGVDLFYVISGFVIGLSAFYEIDRLGPAAFRGPFLARRIARIVPLHYLTILIFVTFVAPELLFHNFWINLTSHLLFLHNLDVRLHGAINGSNWSLATEMQFYVLMLFLAPWIRVARWWILAISFVSVSWVWRYGCFTLVDAGSQLGPYPLFVASTQLPGMLDEFVGGLLLARLVRSDLGKSLLAASSSRLLLPAVTILVMTVTMGIYRHFASYWNYVLMVTLFRSLLTVAFALLLISAISLRLSDRVRAVSAPFFYLGTISYGIYLWHLPVILSVKRLTWIRPEHALAIVIALTLMLASGSWHFFEHPIIQRLKSSTFRLKRFRLSG